jgi:hypothetical protein
MKHASMKRARILSLASILPVFLSASGCSLSVKGTGSPDSGLPDGRDAVEADVDAAGDHEGIPPGCGNGTVGDGEECDDGNDVNGDGCDVDCSYSCHNDDECSDGNECNGIEVCDTTDSHACTEGVPPPEGAPCDDGLFCTITDACDGTGACVGSGNPCSHDLACTVSEDCVEVDDGYACAYDVAAGTCLIDGLCYEDGDENMRNECEECRHASSATAWSPRDDMTECSDGLCCSGECVENAECCADGDCTPRCRGSARPCTTFDQATCGTQQGCGWEPVTVCGGFPGTCSSHADQGTCEACGCTWDPMYNLCSEGIPRDCGTYMDGPACGRCGCAWSSSSTPVCAGMVSCSSFYNSSQCMTCGCVWDTYVCVGYPFSCAMYSDNSTCSSCGCDWSIPCTGGHAACSSYSDDAQCGDQLDCRWSVCDAHHCT